MMEFQRYVYVISGKNVYCRLTGREEAACKLYFSSGFMTVAKKTLELGV
jgi:hypothetical protein